MRESRIAPDGRDGRRRRSVQLGCVLALLAAALPGRAADDPVTDGERLTVIRARKAITISGKEIDDATIVVAGGKIHSIGHALEYPLNAQVIDARDRVVMPGLIDARTRFGLPNYTRNEVHANWLVADEFVPAADEFDALLDAGFTTVALYPAGAGIPGRALIVHTSGPETGRVLQSPAYVRVTNDKKMFREALERAKGEIEKVEKAREEFNKKQEAEKQAQEQKKKEEEKKTGDKPGSQPAPPATQPASQPGAPPAFQPPPIDPALQPLVDLIQKKPDTWALIEVNTSSEFLHMAQVLEKFEIAHAFYIRNDVQSDLAYVAEQLGQRKAKIVLHALIGRVPYSAQRNPLVKQLADAGCEVTLLPLGDNPREHLRLRGRLADLVREGWSRDLALKAVTLHAARLLGLDARLGSLEKGKDAALIFLDGDPLDPMTRVREVMIGGEIVRAVPSAENVAESSPPLPLSTPRGRPVAGPAELTPSAGEEAQ